MKLTEDQIRIIEQAAANNLPANDELRQAAENNPNFKRLQQEVAQQPLVPKNQMKQFIAGMAVLNNAKALNGLYKKTGLYGNKKDRRDITTMVSNGMNLFTKTLANASAALTIQAGDEAKNKLKGELEKGPIKEQAEAKANDVLKLINKAQTNAAAYLVQNRISPKTAAATGMDVPQTDGKVTEGELRKSIRERIKQITEGK